MTTERNDGGPAFPYEHKEWDMSGGEWGWNTKFIAQGMTLRDYFAAKALAALIAEPRWHEEQYSLAYSIGPHSSDEAENCAVAAYKLADAMLKARES